MSLAHDAVTLHIAVFVPAGLFCLQRLCKSSWRRLQSADVWYLAFRSGMRFVSCDMGRAGMQHLVARLPPELHQLELRFRWCSIGSDGAAVLAHRLPRNLTDLQLAFRGCGIGTPGLRAIAESLPASLQ